MACDCRGVCDVAAGGAFLYTNEDSSLENADSSLENANSLADMLICVKGRCTLRKTAGQAGRGGGQRERKREGEEEGEAKEEAQQEGAEGAVVRQPVGPASVSRRLPLQCDFKGIVFVVSVLVPTTM